MQATRHRAGNGSSEAKSSATTTKQRQVTQLTENNTVENIESLFKAAKSSGVPVSVSPHYYYPHGHQWKFEGALELLMHKIGMFSRKGALVQEGFSGSGADWLDRYKPYINDGKTFVTSPRKLYGP